MCVNHCPMHLFFRPFTWLVNINHSFRSGYRLLVPLAPCLPPLFADERDRRLQHYVITCYRLIIRVGYRTITLSIHVLAQTTGIRTDNVPVSSISYSSLSYSCQLRNLSQLNTYPLRSPHLSSIFTVLLSHPLTLPPANL